MKTEGFLVKRDRDGALLRLRRFPDMIGLCHQWLLPAHAHLATFFVDEEELKAVPRQLLRISTTVRAIEERKLVVDPPGGDIAQAAAEDQMALEEWHWS